MAQEITVIQMFGNSSADGAATIDIPQDGRLVGLGFSVGAGGMDAENDGASIEISFNSTNQRTTNDARASIASGKIRVTAATVAAIQTTHLNKEVTLMGGIEVLAGERIYMHILLTSGVSVAALVLLYFEFRKTRRAATRRR